MKLLIVTQVVDANDPVLGFFLLWIEEFSRRAKQVEVICLKEGKHELPVNVRVHSLGKERGEKRFAQRFVYAARFKLLAWRLRHGYDAVFVHMNPEYVVLSGVFWRLSGKRVVLWYTHRQVTWKLRLAALIANVIATAAPESMLLKSKKLAVMGHGVNTAQFIPTERDATFHTPLRLVSIGRITPIKNLEVVIDALVILRTRGVEAELTIVGTTAVPSDRMYERKLHEQISKLNLDTRVHFTGSRAYAQMPLMYSEQDISINAAPTGGIDKVVLEAMACGVPTLVSNKAFTPLLYERRTQLLFSQGDSQELASKIEALYRADDLATLRQWIRRQVTSQASLATLIERFFRLLS